VPLSQWYDSSAGKLHEMLVPADLDLQLSPSREFDIGQFMDELVHHGIEVGVPKRDDWRYTLLLDEHAPTGPFNLDLIEPHITLAHDRVDFDVSNLYCLKGFTRELGMRVDTTEAPCFITLDDTVKAIRAKQFTVTKHHARRDTMDDRLGKMARRGWKRVTPDRIYTPAPDKGGVLTSIGPSDDNYKRIAAAITRSVPSANIIKIESVSNAIQENIYLGMCRSIASECGSHNERELFHGTSIEAANSIKDAGFDNRWFKAGFFGKGAYFADDPKKSHDYNAGNPGTSKRIMFVCKVALGEIEDRGHNTDNTITAPKKGKHSITGFGANLREFIVYRYGQAIPKFMVTYS
jgi:hypothetical protein